MSDYVEKDLNVVVVVIAVMCATCYITQIEMLRSMIIKLTKCIAPPADISEALEV